jgi:hypothetical protein
MLQTPTQNVKYLLFIHGKNGYVNASQCNVIRTLPLLILCLCMCGLSTPEEDGRDRFFENFG